MTKNYKSPKRGMKVAFKKSKDQSFADKTSILIFSDYNCSTGFGVVGTKLIEELQKDDKYIIVVHAINDFSKEPYTVGDLTKVFPAHLNDKGDYFGRIEFLRRLFDIDWDLCFILNDVEIINQLIPHINIVKEKKKEANRKLFKLACYFPIDSPVLPELVTDFHTIDLPITYTEYARDMLVDLNPKLKGKIKVLPHGVDSSEIFPIMGKSVLDYKEKVFGKKNRDAFVFGTVNRNQVRKDMGCILLAFSMFIKNMSPEEMNVVLYFHCNPQDSKGIDLINACKRLGLKVGEQVFFPKDFNENNGVPVNELNLVYNMMDVFVTTTTAEGWGLTVTEAMAAQIPIICPLHTSLIEVTKKGALVESIRPAHTAIFLNDFENIRYISNPVKVLIAMEYLYGCLTDPDSNENEFEHIRQRTQDAYMFAQSLEWSNATKKFKQLLDNLKK